jgi:hypothetical protein
MGGYEGDCEASYEFVPSGTVGGEAEIITAIQTTTSLRGGWHPYIKSRTRQPEI